MNTISKLLAPVILVITGTNAFAQGNSNFFIGADIGYMGSIYNHSPDIPVHINRLSSVQVNWNGVFQMPNKNIIKTGISTYYLRSGLINNEYHYNTYRAVPLTYSFMRFELSKSRAIHMMAGPQISFLNEYGSASSSDEYFDFTSACLGTFKVGITTDICLFNRHGDWVGTFGVKTTVDIPSATLNPNQDIVILDNYISGVFYFGLIREWKQS
ncbi:MAG: hypothetical protein DWQ21_07230 [Bacteroidetes bacterium]|nr:MAG: hypothetical protein DWQ21_07230 [Bacteroidota bacterium]REK64311.1 MAG: hypothetical protein DWQ49_01835 [Bacteroidota bacterium]